jgi:hypothetical protein
MKSNKGVVPAELEGSLGDFKSIYVRFDIGQTQKNKTLCKT